MFYNTQQQYCGETGRIFAVMRMSAVRADTAEENISFLIMENNETCADILSAAKHFILFCYRMFRFTVFHQKM
jgi:hypothetical protein